ncbi:MAG: hypothetical protein WCE28_02400, partial [Bradyrhizobium sp.]
MNKAFEFCIPTRGTEVPTRADWLHEIKYDGYQLRVERDGDRVRLITRNGYDWTKRYPWIVESALKNRMKQFVIDGEAVISSASMVSRISTRCIPASTTRKFSSMPSICSPVTATTCARFLSRCARRTSR